MLETPVLIAFATHTPPLLDHPPRDHRRRRRDRRRLPAWGAPRAMRLRSGAAEAAQCSHNTFWGDFSLILIFILRILVSLTIFIRKRNGHDGNMQKHQVRNWIFLLKK